jgi:hypothetical protein
VIIDYEDENKKRKDLEKLEANLTWVLNSVGADSHAKLVPTLFFRVKLLTLD